MTKWIVPLLAALVVVGFGLFQQAPVQELATSPGAGPAESSIQTPWIAPVTASDPWLGLSLNDFLIEADRALTLLSPETITWLGLADEFGVRNDQLDALSVQADLEYYALVRRILERLGCYNLACESEADRTNARIYTTSLCDALRSQPYADNGYLVSSYMDSYPTCIEWFMTSIHPLGTRRDAEDYLARLSQIPARFVEVQDRLARSEAIGAVPPRFMLEKAVEQLRTTGKTPPKETSFFKTLDDALSDMEGLDRKGRDTLLQDAVRVIGRSVLPAYLRLADHVEKMAARATDDAGVWKERNGAGYYAYCLESQTTTALSAEEIYQLGLKDVARIEAEIQEAAVSLGFPRGVSIPTLYQEVKKRTGVSLGEETIERCQALIDGIGQRVAPGFVRMPTQKIVVVDGGGDMYFSAGTLDGSRPGMFFADTEDPQPIYELPTVTYHEAVPGHGFQSAYAYSADLPPYVTGLSFTSYSEGWALYAERLAWEKGAYTNDTYGNLGRLQDELFRAVRLVVDPGIHARQWTYEQAVQYMSDHTGFDEVYVRDEVERYIVSPGQAVTYKIGMQKLLELRARAQTALGDAFDLAQFHDVVLSHGELPLSILEELVDEYIKEHQG
jgi:uncharacterized protein (DUF885 family)